MKLRLTVCRCASDQSIPEWSRRSEWLSVTKTGDELSVICASEAVPSGVVCERGFRLLKVEGPLPFSAVGVLARLTGVLAEAGVPILAVSTYDTDYLLVRESQLLAAIEALRRADYEVREREALDQDIAR